MNKDFKDEFNKVLGKVLGNFNEDELKKHTRPDERK